MALPPFPSALGYLWTTFLRLRRRAPVGFAGPQPIGWQDIDAFVRRSALRLMPWEVEIIEALDDIYLRPEDSPPPPQGGDDRVLAAATARDGTGLKGIVGSVGVRKVVKRKGK